MNQATLCCRNPATLTTVQSPFSKILALDFYDGPMAGILQCETCHSVYKFDMLDWDEDHEVRIFRLAALPSESLAQCVAALAQPEPPRWPVWVPSREKLPSEQVREEVDRAVQRFLAQAKSAELIVAWSGYGERILAAKSVPAKELNEFPDWFSLEDPHSGRDWFAVLGLVREKRAAGWQPSPK